jgi:16S rRNA U516 pseudouridylate synthase RsuA-like enzyme
MVMSRKLDSRDWTGDYPNEAHYPLASPEGRRRHVRFMVAALGLALIGIAAVLVWQGLA